jgi:hypothetical protein
MRARMRPEHRHLVDVMAEIGWRTARPTDTGLPRVFFKYEKEVRYEVKRNPKGLWRLRVKLPDLYVGAYVFPRWAWIAQEHVFETPAAAALWFDRVELTLIKMRGKTKCA